ncbi:hypothetical protein, partial [Paraclostridium dentum]|uniref:hypothetical protein n=1 Tax=Paraclostridium dentum TaxID=2662455 RepID=UPI003F3CC4EF
VNTSADVPSHIFSIVLYAEEESSRVAAALNTSQSVRAKQSCRVLQGALSLWGPEFDLFGHNVIPLQ